MTREDKRNELYDFLVESGIATVEELELVAHICGFTLETMEAVLCERTGYSDLNQYFECEYDWE